MDFQFQDEMYLAKILLPAGAEDVQVGTPLAIMVENQADIAEVQKQAATAPAPKAAPAAAAAAPAAAAPAAGGAGSSSSSFHLDATTALPAARMLLAGQPIDPASIKGTGKGGRITKGDVLQAMGKVSQQEIEAVAASVAAAAAPPGAKAGAAAAAAAPAAPQQQPAAAAAAAAASSDRPGRSYKDTKPSNVRKVIASRLTESKAGIPHQYAVMDCKLDAALKLRAQLKDAGVSVSVNDLVIKAAARALKEVPEVNCFFSPKEDAIKANSTIDISVAVATDGGLITPIVKNADQLGLGTISEKVKELAGRARANKLKPEEFQGGSFSISNLGMFGIDQFSAVINPPQACILAVGKGEKKVLGAPIASLDELDPSAKVPPPTVATVMTVMMSSDARVVDDALAARFLQVFRRYVENPIALTA